MDEQYDVFASPEITTPSVPELLSNQMNIELNNFHTYINLSSLCDIKGYIGSSNFFKKQADGELEHFEKFRSYICDRNFTPVLSSLPAKPIDSLSLLDMMVSAYQLECNTTKELTTLKVEMGKAGDYVSFDFLDWYLLEQVEEMKLTGDYVQRLKLAGDNTAALLIIDQELGNV